MPIITISLKKRKHTSILSLGLKDPSLNINTGTRAVHVNNPNEVIYQNE